MLQNPLPAGAPAEPYNDNVYRISPVVVRGEQAESPSAGPETDATETADSAAPRPGVHWREVRWVGFAAGPRPDLDDETGWQVAAASARNGRAALLVEPVEDGAVVALPATTAVAASVPVPTALTAEPPARSDQALRSRASLRPRLVRIARILAGAVVLIAVAVFAYRGGERSAGLADAMTRPAEVAALEQPTLPAAATTALEAAPPQPARAATSNFLARARAGDPVAQYNLGVLYARGEGVPQDFFTAAAWFREAALSGNVAAQYNLGVMYERGLGVRPNTDEAVLWYRRAAERNYAAAQYNLAIAYTEGRGISRDPPAAALWYHQAALQGLVPAMFNFALLYEKGEGVDRSPADAYAWYRAAARRGDAAAAKRAGELFQNFGGTEKARAVMLAAAVLEALGDPGISPPHPPPPAPAAPARSKSVSVQKPAPHGKAPAERPSPRAHQPG